jgi:2-amino-4-hydroxy-6-hydroxymethyldihydropteridine diphosphokinase
MSVGVLALGSNLGDREAHLREAVRALSGSGVLRAVSGVYETPPWGDPDQPEYLNAAAVVADPSATPRFWLDLAQDLERRAGRVRDPQRRFGPRTLDVDVIAVRGDSGEPAVVSEPDLVLPHPRAHLRAFVLRPWIDIEPYAALPGHGWVSDLLRADPVAGDLAALRPRPDLDLETEA